MRENSLESRRWLMLRRNLFKQVAAQVQEYLGGESKGLVRYRQEYENEFHGKWKVDSRESLLATAESARFLFLGDFHALQQSQRAQLRILKAMKNTKNLTLAVEFFEEKSQSKVDAYLAGKISEKELLQVIDWPRNWGFPWEHYRPLLRWALKKKIPVIGINQRSDNRSIRSLYKRDRFSAAIIAKLAKDNPKKRIAIIYGDLHLAGRHLPFQISKKMGYSIEADSVSVFQNSEQIYFSLLEKGLELTVDVVRLNKGKYCILSVPPWVKWQNYLMFLEQAADFELGEEDRIDPTDQIAKYAEIIAQDLGVEINLNEFSVETAGQSQFWSRLKSQIGAKELGWYQTYIQSNRSFYLPQLKLGYLARFSVNHAAAIAASIVYSQISSWQIFPWRMPKDFLRLIWLETLQFFASKMINPKRKSDTVLDLRAALSSKLPDDQGREALQLALSQKMQELLYLIEGRRVRKLPQPKHKGSYIEAAQLLGGIMGEKLYHAYRNQLLSRKKLHLLLKKPIASAQFSEIYYEALKLIENFPEPFASKVEKL